MQLYLIIKKLKYLIIIKSSQLTLKIKGKSTQTLKAFYSIIKILLKINFLKKLKN
jgi:hypothetical protein